MEDSTRSNRNWIKPTILLCSFGFITSIKPSEPYITLFLMGPRKNLTEGEVVNEIYPTWSYSYTAFLIPIFLLTDFLRYKPTVILQSIGYIGCWVLLVFAKGVFLMILMQVFYGLATACEIGYYSYIYSVVESDRYQKATSYVRTTAQLGSFLGSLLSQLLISLAYVDYWYLNVISLADVSAGLVISLFLPFPKRSLYFYRQTVSDEVGTNVRDDITEIPHLTKSEEISDDGKIVTEKRDQSESLHLHQFKSVVRVLLHDLKKCYSSTQTFRWSVWWALSTCGWIFVVNYIQNLWENIKPSQGHESEVYNGAVECVARILGATAAFAVGYIIIDWKKWGEVVIGLGSMLEAGLLFIMANTNDILVCYAAYIGIVTLYNFVITISQFRIAIGLTTERFALVFGMNTFIAVVLNSLLTLIIVDKAVLGLDVVTQFFVYCGYFGIIAVAYLSHGIYDLLKKPRDNEVFVECA